LHGIVRDEVPYNQGLPIAGARIEVVYGSAAGPSTISAADGSYRLDGVVIGRPMTLKVSHEGYVSSFQATSLTADDVSIDVRLMPIFVTVRGIVTEAADAKAVESAVIVILDGTRKGMAVVSDAAGAFELVGVWREFDISVSRAGFEPSMMHVNPVVPDRVVVRLTPLTSREHVSFSGSLCTTEKLPPWLTCSAPFERTHMLPITRPGSLTLTVNYVYVGDYYANSLMLDIRCGSRMVTQKKLIKGGYPPPTVMPDNVVGTFEVQLPWACDYDLHLSNYIADTKGGSQTTYRVDAAYLR
jgi:hypothetical protein